MREGHEQEDPADEEEAGGGAEKGRSSSGVDLPEDGRRGAGEQKGQELEEVGQHQAVR